MDILTQKPEADPYVNEMDWGALDLPHYRTYQYRQVSRYVGQDILEIGSGDRNFTREIIADKRHHVSRLVSIEPSLTLYQQYQHRVGFPASVSFHNTDLFDPSLERFGMFDTAIMIHVLEHIEKDAEAVATIYSRLKPGGRFLIEVPAIPWLFSHHDRSLGHYRRYTKKALRALFHPDRFELEELSWHDPIGMLGSIYFFKLKSVRLRSAEGKELIGKQGVFYDNVLIPLQSHMERFIRFPIGLSLTAVARKRG